jgi:hypothetical protein
VELEEIGSFECVLELILCSCIECVRVEGLDVRNGGGWGYIYSPNNNYSRWTESSSFLSTGIADSLVPWPRQSTVEVCGSRSLDPSVARLSGGYRAVWCHSPRAHVVGLSMQIARCPTRHFVVHCPVRHQALADYPFIGFLR